MRSYLEIIVRNDRDKKYITHLLTDDPVRLAAQLREAKRCLETMDHSFHNNTYLDLAPVTLYSFRMEKDRVIAKLKVPKAIEGDEVPIYHELKEHTFLPAKDALTAIGYIMEHKEILKIIFPSLEAIEIPRLRRWAEKNHYEVNLGESGASVRKTDG